MKSLTINLALRHHVRHALGDASPMCSPVGRLSSLSFTAIALILSQPAMAAVNCPGASSSSVTTCTIQADQGGNGASVNVDFTGATGVKTSPGSSGGSYTVINNGASLGPNPPAGIFVRLKGGYGSSDTSNNATGGGVGGYIGVNNSGAISVSGQPATGSAGAAPGLWDDAGAQYGLYAASVGGNGANAASTVIGGGNGGYGGNGNQVNISNTASVSVTRLPFGGVGIYGASIGGAGGKEDPAGSGDQNGGNGGNTDAVTLTNSGNVLVSDSAATGHAWGIGVETIGGNGGQDNGWGGSVITRNPNVPSGITNSGQVTVNVGGSNFTNGVRGLYVTSQGGNGLTSSDGSDNGGQGGAYSGLSVVNSGPISVTSNAVAAPASLASLSGGIVVVGRGGNGGAGPQTATNTSNRRGGMGGSTASANTAAVALNGGSSVFTNGNYLSGVNVVSVGGAGGDGREDTDGANGGAGGQVQVVMNDNATVATNGLQAHGIAARSYGGAGGAVQTSSGLVDFTQENAGSGGAGGLVTLLTGDANGRSGGVITTTGDYSIGMLGQSMGGIGGLTTGNFELFGNAGANAGRGGASGTVNVDSRSTINTSGASSHGIVAQAIGAGGGTAGASDGIIGVGGAGGTAVAGGNVTVNQSGNMSLGGTGAIGILAQSIGGGGGDGGSGSGVIIVGGQGGGGGAGGTATTSVNGYQIKTRGDQGYGVVTQAIGGGGGTGGAASSYSVGVGFALSVAVGGSGGNGGQGGTATSTIDNATIMTGDGNVPTIGNDAHGLVVQSIGGGGGAGGASMAKSYAIAVPDEVASGAVAASIAVGGSGGNGGVGSTATAALNNSSIITYGANAMGAVVQSIGGGGGVGGSASATSTVIGTENSVGGTVEMAVGGAGGSGNTGGNASFTLQGSRILTSGDSANAIFVQSVGGGGGAGGVGSASGNSVNTDSNIDINLSVGGKGNVGGSGGTATLTTVSNSTVTTRGDGARGAIVQSIGGGGGASQGGQVGIAVSAASEESSTDVSSTVAVGRGGAGGGNGGAITLNSDGQITTYGADADGLLVQSIGGSGGIGGAVGGDSGDGKSRPSLNDSGTSYTLNASVGGTGGGGGSGGNIGESNAAASLGAYIQTYGDYADAVVLQTIGGGGGAGGVSTASSSLSTSDISLSVGGKGGAGGNGGSITAFLNGNGGNGFITEGYGAAGIVMQSIGGGGGTAGTGSPLGRGKLSVGGGGSNPSFSGAITVTPGSYASIQTKGDSAYGLVMQSIAGGGGIAMAGSSRSATLVGQQAFDMNVGTIPSTGTAGSINASTGLNMDTYGDRAIGVIAQSIGGGGGIASAGAANGNGSVALGGGYGDGGTVTLSLQGILNTYGAGAHGVVAQSISGGGGIVGDVAQPIQLDPGGFKGASSGAGTGQVVNVSFEGTLNTSGANAHGIVAQSIGGGGGLGGGAQSGFAGSTGSSGNANLVNVTVLGPVTATGAGSSGVFAQSKAPGINSAVTVIVNDRLRGGSGSGAGAWIAAGRDNQLTINAGGSVSALSGVAVRYSGDNSTANGSRLNIDNFGVLQGSVLCSNGDGSVGCNLTNHTNAVASNAQAYDANVNNNGLMVIGTPGRFETLTVSGTLTQSASGVLRADVDFDQMRSARMVVQGDANLAGAVDVLPRALLPGRDLTVLTVKGNSQGALAALDSPVFNYETRTVAQDTTLRVASADFNAASLGLKENQRNVASHLQRIWNGGGNSALAPLFAQLDMASRQGASAYRNSVATLSPGVTIAPAAQSAANLAQFTGAMMSCPTFTGADAITREQNCAWGLVTGRSTTQDSGNGVEGFDFDTVTYQVGGQREVSPGWFVGGSAAYQNNHLRGSDRKASGKGDSGYLGALVKRETGPWVFSAALGAGYGSYEMDRQIDIAGYQETLESRPDVYGVNARLRAARFFAIRNDMYLKPYVDLDASYSKMPGYKESGSNPLALSVKDADQFVLGLSPMLEFGGRKELSNKAVLRPFVYAGVTFLSQNDWKSSARLRGAPAGAASFDTSLPMDNVVGKIGAGLQVTKAGKVDFRLQYDGQFGQKTRSNSATLKVMMPF